MLILRIACLAWIFYGVVFTDDRNPISAPKAGETVQAEKPYTVRWTPGSPGAIKL